MLNLIIPTWSDLAGIAQPAFLMMAVFVAVCGFILLRREV